MQMADCVDQVLFLLEVRASAPPRRKALRFVGEPGQSAGRTETSVLYSVLYPIRHMSRSVIRACLLF